MPAAALARHARGLLRWLRRRPRSLAVLLLACLAVVGLLFVQLHVCPEAEHELCKLSLGSYFTLVLTLVALLLMCNDVAPDYVLMACTTLLMLTGVITNEEALKGFCSASVLAIGAMFPIARALEEVQAVDRVVRPVLGRPRGPKEAILRLCLPTWVLSMFLANTPLVATMLSPCESWAARSGLHASILLMPLSFASMLGGMCTLIGTSTNLVLNSQIEQDPNPPIEPFGMFSMSIVAVPGALVGLFVLIMCAPILLVRRQPKEAATTANDPGAEPTLEKVHAHSAAGRSTRSLTYLLGVRQVRVDGYRVEMEVLAQFEHLGLSMAELSQALNAVDGPGCLLQILYLQREETVESQDPNVKEIPMAFMRQADACSNREQISESKVNGAVNEHPIGTGKPAKDDSNSNENNEDTEETARHRPSLGVAKCFDHRIWRRSKGEKRISTSSLNSAFQTRHKVAASSQRGSLPANTITTTSVYCPNCHPQQWGELRLCVGDLLCLTLVAEALPRLRALEGVRLGQYGTTKDEHISKNDCLVEACVRADSPLVGLTVDEASKLPLLEQTIVWGARFCLAESRSNEQDEDLGSRNRKGGGTWQPATPPLPRPSFQRSHSDPALFGSLPSWNDLKNAPRLSLIPKSRGEVDSIEIQVEIDEPDVSGSDRMLSHHCVGSNRRTWCGSTLTLAPGDTLLLEASTFFTDVHRYSVEFALLNEVAGSRRVKNATDSEQSLRRKRWLAMAALLTLLALSAAEVVSLLPLSMALSFLLVVTGCITIEQAWHSIAVRVLVTIAASFGLGAALERTHIASLLASILTDLSSSVPPVVFLMMIFLFTAFLTCIISNAACVVLLYSVLRSVDVAGLSTRRMMLVMMIGASSAFATPIGYQTNLIVFGRGGYRFGDFFLLGSILTFTLGGGISVLAWMLPESLLS